MISADAGIYSHDSSSLRSDWGGEGEIAELLYKSALVQITSFWIRFITEKEKEICATEIRIQWEWTCKAWICHNSSGKWHLSSHSGREDTSRCNNWTRDGKLCFMPGVSLSSRDCLVQITGVLPHDLAKMEEFLEQLEMLSRKILVKKSKTCDYLIRGGEGWSIIEQELQQRLIRGFALSILKVKSHLCLIDVRKEAQRTLLSPGNRNLLAQGVAADSRSLNLVAGCVIIKSIT